ncbi:hypothetical protein MMC07_006285 [Pseudocyphellaria aurata]|nr:hypothetical protein [Pseudocyphellaria aurata]
MNVIVTGAGGFIGQILAAALVADSSVSKLTLTDLTEPPLPSTPHSKVETRCVAADLTSVETCKSLFTADLTVIYLLHGLMSGSAEANLELGLKINLDSMRQIFDILREVKPGVRVVFPSSCAVYGPPGSPKSVITERDAPLPGTSYGAQKLISEVLLNDFSRRGLLDGRILRLPTIMVRPGAPTGAASSFASGIFREPLHGEKGILPVPKSQEVWICSPKTVVENLIRARDIPAERFGGQSRVVNLPGITVTVQQMLDVLKAVGGERALSLVEEQQDESTARIVASWPARLNTARASELGFKNDGSLVQTVRDYVEQYGIKKEDPSVPT